MKTATLLVSVLSLLALLTLLVSVTANHDSLLVTAISEKHGLIDHQVVVKAENHNVLVPQPFIPHLGINMDKGAVSTLVIEERTLISVNESIINQTCVRRALENGSIQRICTSLEIGTEEKTLEEWIPLAVGKSGNSWSAAQTLIAPQSEKVYRLTWQTPLTNGKMGWGSDGSWQVNPSGWWNSSCQARVPITTNKAKIGGNISGLPMYVNAASLPNSLFLNINVNSTDIFLIDQDNVTELKREFVSINKTAKTGSIFFNTSVTPDYNRTYWVYYDCSINRSSDLNTWNKNFSLVYHLDENPGGIAPQGLDSSQRANNLSAGASPAHVDGKLGKAWNFSRELLQHANSSKNIDISNASSRTMIFWAKADNLGQNALGWGFEGTNQLWHAAITSPGEDQFYWGINGFGGGNDITTNVTADKIVHHHAITYDGSVLRWYLDGSLWYSTSKAFNTEGRTLFRMAFRPDNPAFYWSGWLDEVYVINSSLSSGYISTIFNNQNDSGTFYNVGQVEAFNGAPIILANHTVPASPSLNHTNVYLNVTANDTEGDGISAVYFWVYQPNGTALINGLNGTKIGGNVSAAGGEEWHSSTFNITNALAVYGNWTWNLTVMSSGGDPYNNRSSSGSFLIEDTTKPSFTVISPVGTVSSRTFNVTVSIIEPAGLSQCYFNITRGASQEISNTNLTGCYTKEVSVSSDADYQLHLFAQDINGNWNSSNYSFSVATSAGGGSSGGGGGGGGGAVVVIGANSQFTMETESGSGKYELRMTRGSIRTKSILFENLGSTAVDLTLSLEGQLAENIKLSATKVTLPLTKETKTSVDFDIAIPADLPDGKYSTNIIASSDPQTKGIVTVEVTVGRLSAPIEFLERMKSSTLIAGKIKVPYFLIFAGAWIFIAFAIHQIGLKKIKSVGLFLSILTGFVVGAILVLL